MPERLLFPDRVQVIPGSWKSTWLTSLQELSQESVLDRVRSVVIRCDPSTVEGRRGSVHDTFKHCLGHPDLANIFRILCEAPKLDYLELNLEQGGRGGIKVPWDWFGQTQLAIADFLMGWQERSIQTKAGSTPRLGKLVIRFILNFPFAILKTLHCLHVESSTLALTSPNLSLPGPLHHPFSTQSLVLYNASSTAAFFCGNATLDTASLKDLRMTVANRAELEVAFSLLGRISSYITKLGLSFRNYTGGSPTRIVNDIYIPTLKDLLIEFKEERIAEHAFPFLYMLRRSIIPLERLRLATDGPVYPDLDKEWTTAERLKWNLFQALAMDDKVFPFLKYVSVDLAGQRDDGAVVPVISDKMNSIKARLKEDRGITVDFRSFTYD